MRTPQAFATWSPVALSVALICSLATSTHAADSPRELHPVDAVFYVEYDGREKHDEAVHNTAAHAAFHDSGLEELSIATMDFVQEVLNKNEQTIDAAQFFEGLRTAVSRGLEHGVSVSIAIPQEGMPVPRMTLVLHDSGELVSDWAWYAGEMANKYPEAFDDAELIQKTIEERDVTAIAVKGEINAEIATWKEGNHALLTIGLGSSKWAMSVATGKMENITANKTIAEGLATKADFEVIMHSVLDTSTLLRKYEGFTIPNDSGEPLTVGDLFKMTGMNKLGLMTCQSGYKDTAIWTVTKLQCKGSEKEQTPSFSLTDLPPLPWDTTAATAFNIDLTGDFRGLKKLVESALAFAPKREREQAFEIFDNLNKVVGFDIEKDLLDSFGDLACFYVDPDGGSYGLGFGIAIKVKDNEKLLKTMGQIEAKLKDVGDSPVFLLPSEKLDRTMYLTEFYIEEGSIQYGAMGIDKDWFVIGLMPQTVTSFFHRLDGSIISWEPTEELKECLDEMPKSYHQVSFADVRGATRLAYNWLVFVSPFLQSGIYNSGVLEDEQTLPFHVEDLPPAELIIDPLFPNVTTCTKEGDTYIWTTRSSTGLWGMLGLY